MPRIQPINQETASSALKISFQKHITTYNARITNMKATLAHSPLAFDTYMMWYPLFDEVEKIVGKRSAYLFAHAISTASNCPLCSTFFRRIIIESGEKPENLVLSSEEQELLDLGSDIAQNKGEVNNEVYQKVAKRYEDQEMVILLAFAGQMIATNVFNNVIETEIDEYLSPYIK